MKETVNPYEMELLDLWNEVDGQMIIKYHRATFTPAKEDLQKLRDNDFPTDVLTVILQLFLGYGWGEEEIKVFFQEADAAGAAPAVSFEATDGEVLNITGKENNPMVDCLVQTVSNQEPFVSIKNSD